MRNAYLSQHQYTKPSRFIIDKREAAISVCDGPLCSRAHLSRIGCALIAAGVLRKAEVTGYDQHRKKERVATKMIIVETKDAKVLEAYELGVFHELQQFAKDRRLKSKNDEEKDE